jgi:hypothetical protein
MVEALEPFDGIIDQLISSAPSDLAQPSYRDHVGPDY